MTTHKLDASWQAKFKDAWRKAVLYDHSLTMGNKAVAVATLEDYNREDPKQVGTTFNKATTLAEKLGCNEKLVRDSWKALRDAGYLHSLGRSSSGRGVYIHRFDLPGEIRPDKMSGQTGQNVRTERTKCPMEQGELNKKNEQVESPNGAHLTDERPRSIHSFLDEEPERREEFVNYLIAINAPYSYRHALDTFTEAMTDENRTDWAGTFKAYLAGLIDHDGGLNPDNGDPLGMAVYMTEQTELESEDGFCHLDIARAWQGHRDGVSEDEFRRAWEHGLMDHNGTRLMSVASSELVANKYPRELLTVIDSLSRAELSKLAAKFRIQNL